jgi:hypothetical protein
MLGRGISGIVERAAIGPSGGVPVVVELVSSTCARIRSATASIKVVVAPECSLITAEVIVHWTCRRLLLEWRRLCLIVYELTLWPSRRRISWLLIILLVLPKYLISDDHMCDARCLTN